MTIAAIEQRAASEAAKYDAAKKIREILDAAIKASGSDDVEQEIIDIVTEAD